MLGVAPIVAAIWFSKLSSKFATSARGHLAVRPARGRGRRGMVRRAPAVPAGREQLLVAQLAGRAARLHHVPRGAAPAGRAAGCRRGPPRRSARGCAHAALVSGAADLRRRAGGAGGGAGRARICCAARRASGRPTIWRSSRSPTPSCWSPRYLAVAALAWAIADATMAQPQDLDAIRRRVRGRAAPGASRTCRTSTSSASATASGSKAAGRGRAATNACSGCSRNWIAPCRASRSTWSSSPAT